MADTQGDNVLDGSAGNDTLIAGSGNDVLKGSSGDDRLFGGTGDDQIDGGEGKDLALFTGKASDYRLEKVSDTSVRVTGPDGIDVVTAVETLKFDDQEIATSSILGTPSTPPSTGPGTGGNGSNQIVGTSGDDQLADTEGDDTVRGLEGNDTIAGTRGKNVLDGGAGNDTIAGGLDEDVVQGGSGDDVVSVDWATTRLMVVKAMTSLSSQARPVTTRSRNSVMARFV